MSSADVFAQIERMGELPSLPRTLLEIQRVASDDRSSADDLAACILRDQALTVRVLKVVNSAMYRGGEIEETRSVRRAVIRLGFDPVRKLALGLSVFDMMSKLSRSPWLAELGRHSLITAGFARALAAATPGLDPEEAFVAALIHDVGKIVLLECSPAALDRVLADAAAGVDPLAAERRHFGLTHDRAGRRLAVRWGLPFDLQTVIGDHHDIDPLRPPRKLAPELAVIVFADALAKLACGDGDTETEPAVLRQAGRTLKLPASRLDDIRGEAVAQIRELSSLVGIDAGELRDYAGLVNVDGGVLVAPLRMSAEEMAERTARQLELYQEVGRGLAAGRPATELLQTILEGAVEVLGFERVILLDVDRDARELRPRCWAGIDAGDLAPRLNLPLVRATGALALAVLEQRSFHVPMADSEAYDGLVGQELLQAARCAGFAVAPIQTAAGYVAVIYADGGPNAEDVVAEQATELAGLALQAGLVMGAGRAATSPASESELVR
ncbi:MAG: HDOD domain-containing protein [bacterium]|nr:HDOD domain-containing protein [bacterium]